MSLSPFLFLLLLLLLLLFSFLFYSSALNPLPHAPHILHHPQFGLSFFLPLSTHTPTNRSFSHHGGFSNARLLSPDNASVNAKMNLYDDLLTKGYYTTRLWIGTPPQEFALIVDTGSTVTYVPCSSCTHCGKHQDPGFKPEESSSYKPMPCGPKCNDCDSNRHQCKYERRYAEMSTSEGLLGDDLISFGNVSSLAPERLVFGCETSETGDIYEQRADGIMGLGRGRLSIVDQLVGLKAMSSSFSLCYGGMNEGGGAMIMGATASPPNMIFTRSDFTRSAYYNLGLQQIFVAGTQLSVDPSVFDSNFGTILDSGTTYAYFPDVAFKSFKSVLMQKVKLRQVPGPDPQYPDVCFAGAGSDVSKLSDHFPDVQLKFGDGQTVSLTPENYLFQHLKVEGGYCLGIFGNGKDSATLLGGIVVRNMLVTYDRINQRIGFWKTNCSDLWNNLRTATLTELPAPAAAPSQSPPAGIYDTKSGCVSGNLYVTMQLSINYTSFTSLKSEFIIDLSQALEIDLSQISLSNYTNSGESITIVITIHLAATDGHLLHVLVKKLESRLSGDGYLSDQFKEYQVIKSTFIPSDARPVDPKRLWVLISLVVAFAVLIFSGIGILVWWRMLRHKDQKYISLEESVEMSNQLQHS